MKKLFLIFVLIPFINAAFSQEDPVQRGLDAITLQAIQGQLEFLASDWTEGRGTGEKGEYMAGDYIASIFKIYGLQPAGDYKFTDLTREQRWDGQKPEKYRSFFQEFGLIKSKPGDAQCFSAIVQGKRGEKTYDFNYKTDFTFSETPPVSMSATGPVVFAGYGYVDEEKGYDDFKNLDVEGKVIIRLAGFPGINDTSSEAYKKFHPQGRYGYYYLQRNKNKAAIEKGAIAVIEPGYKGMQKDWSSNIPFRHDTEIYEGVKKLESPYEYNYRLPKDTLENEPLFLKVTPAVLNLLLEGSGIDTESFHDEMATDPKPKPRELKGKFVSVSSTIESEIITARNVLGMIEGKNPDSLIILGAHYDHLGIHGDYIWNGADDNASGTVGVMTIAKAFMATGTKPENTIVFAAWTGEERGLLGSTYFVKNPVKPVENILINLNFDMISRDSKNDTLKNKCSMGYLKDYTFLEEMTNKNNEKYGLGLELRYWKTEGGRGGSDHAPFSEKGIPFCFFIAGFTTDYHQPTDEVEKVNFDKMNKIIKLGFLNAWKLDQMKTQQIRMSNQ